MREAAAKIEFKNYSMCLRDAVEIFTKELINCLFDEQYQQVNGESTKNKFFKILERLSIENKDCFWLDFESSFIEIRRKLDLDALAALNSDPAAKSLREVYLAYPGFYAIAVYRLSNQLLKQEIPVLPRMMSEFAHSATGTDIHPGAEIGDSFFIDHATGIVIGETTIIKDNVTIFQGVTLGGIQVKKSLASIKRHPTIENGVVIYANATILGGNVLIGANSVIGANVCITASISENSVVTVKSENNIFQRS
ncbi:MULTISPECIES: serine O-acetyltransferase EpsC [unclassified Polaribacter]|uniref:serine O-acetyltransferase EpsC n=1 Tax=unclassified Polaribacter TaxID=196858 RepID=UPI0011BF5A05|nr:MULTISPECIES: serine O-acetyltransferase EpsC [unclassified Polaribacter]TXD50774.1 serine acetyltransferase [Polaribacter sp. IC063]TXD57442.1 serine acetyltransferase [Polaribacter sp. IC066]